jgi:hypothetical protein
MSVASSCTKPFSRVFVSTNASASSASATATSSPSPTLSGTQGTSSGQNTGAIVGGIVGGVVALVIVAATLLFYRRYKRRNDGRPSADEGAALDPFIEVTPTSLVGAASSTYRRTLMGLPVTEVSMPTCCPIQLNKHRVLAHAKK